MNFDGQKNEDNSKTTIKNRYKMEGAVRVHVNKRNTND